MKVDKRAEFYALRPHNNMLHDISNQAYETIFRNYVDFYIKR
jgi:hypothetical protein